jgi:hypothetical protein
MHIFINWNWRFYRILYNFKILAKRKFSFPFSNVEGARGKFMLNYHFKRVRKL